MLKKQTTINMLFIIDFRSYPRFRKRNWFRV